MRCFFISKWTGRRIIPSQGIFSKKLPLIIFIGIAGVASYCFNILPPIYYGGASIIFLRMSFLRRFHLNHPLGERGEDEAVRFLKKNHFTILERNWKNRTGRAIGEVDIIAKEGAEIVFIEVKTRAGRHNELILPEENITRSKLSRLSRIAEVYMKEKNMGYTPYRFDAVLVIFFEKEEIPEIRHIRSIFL